MPTQVDPPYSENPVSRLNIVTLIENFFLYEREFRSTEYKSKSKKISELWHELICTPGVGGSVIEDQLEILDKVFEGIFGTDAPKFNNPNNFWKKQKEMYEQIIWNIEQMKFWLTSKSAKLLPVGYKFPMFNEAQRRRERLDERGIKSTQVGDFTTVEEIVRWLGYSRIYENQEECLFTGIKLNSADIIYDEDVIETSIFIPLLDTSNVPKIRVHRSVMKSDGWITTREGCDYPFPHVKLSRYKNKDLREQICTLQE